MYKVVLDTNVYISSFFWKGKSNQIVRQAIDKDFEVYVSEDIFTEIRKVLKRDFEISNDKIVEMVFSIFLFAKIVKNNQTIDVIKDDPSDNRILECALSCNADFIITGDNHLLRLRNFEGIKILNPNDFIDFRNNP